MFRTSLSSRGCMSEEVSLRSDPSRHRPECRAQSRLSLSLNENSESRENTSAPRRAALRCRLSALHFLHRAASHRNPCTSPRRGQRVERFPNHERSFVPEASAPPPAQKESQLSALQR